jgi:hypothetical protein
LSLLGEDSRFQQQVVLGVPQRITSSFEIAAREHPEGRDVDTRDPAKQLLVLEDENGPGNDAVNDGKFIARRWRVSSRRHGRRELFTAGS